jgi:hypothetical protein
MTGRGGERGGGVISHDEVLLERGRKLFRDGEPMPPRPTDENDCEPAAIVWYGWMLARAAKMRERWRVMDLLGVRHD